MLYNAISTARTPLLIEEASAIPIFQQIGQEAPQGQMYSSRLLNRQFKSVIFGICQKLINLVLGELEKALRKRQRETWPSCFIGILLLCATIEEIQYLIYSHTSVAKSSQDPGPLDRLENEPHASCNFLDEAVYGQLIYVFHALFRTSKGQKGGLNPFGAEFRREDEPGFDDDDAVMEMIQEIKEKVMMDEEGTYLPALCNVASAETRTLIS